MDRIHSLSSTTIITDESGTIVSEMKYTAFGEIRDINGTSPTDYLYTGQRKEVEFGLSYYVARWFDASTGHFISADTLDTESKPCFDLRRIYFVNSPIATCCVGDSQARDRYAYVLNNPLKYIDPSGHVTDAPFGGAAHLLDGDNGMHMSRPSAKTEPELVMGSHRYHANEVAELFELLSSTADGWLTTNGPLSIEEFNGMMVLQEAGGDPKVAKIIAKAVIQQLYVGGWGEKYCIDGFSTNGSLNFWAHYSQSVQGLVQAYVRDSDTHPLSDYNGPGSKGIQYPGYILGVSTMLGDMIAHPSEINTDQYNALSQFGISKELMRKLNVDETIKPFTFYPNGNQGIYYYDGDSGGAYYSVNGWNHWMNAKYINFPEEQRRENYR